MNDTVFNMKLLNAAGVLQTRSHQNTSPCTGSLLPLEIRVCKVCLVLVMSWCCSHRLVSMIAVVRMVSDCSRISKWEPPKKGLELYSRLYGTQVCSRQDLIKMHHCAQAHHCHRKYESDRWPSFSLPPSRLIYNSQTTFFLIRNTG